MLESQEISEEDSIQGDCGIDKDAGWISHDTSSSLPSEMGEISSLIERMVQARISDVLKERDNLREELKNEREEKARILEENGRLRNIVADQNLQIYDIKEKHKQEQNINAYECGNTCLSSENVEYDAASMVDIFESLKNDLLAFKIREKNGKNTSMFTAKQTAIILKAFLLEHNSLTNNTKNLAPLLQRFGGWSPTTAENALGYEVTQGECDKLAKEFDGFAPKIGNIIRVYPQKYTQVKHKRLQKNLKS